MCIGAAASLHGATGQGTRHGIRGNTVKVEATAVPIQLHMAMSFGVFTREIEEIYTSEDCEETAQERDCVDSIAGVEALEKDEGCDKGAGGEGDVVQRVDTGLVSRDSVFLYKTRHTC